MKILIFLFVAVFAGIQARLFEGQCRARPAPVISPFNYKRYLGEWYEIEWYDDEYATFDECIKFTYTRTSTNAFNMSLDLKDAANDFNSQRYEGNGFVSGQSLLSSLPLLGPIFSQGKLSTTFGSGVPTRVNHQILATDYVNYAFVWDCANVNETHYNEKMWYFDRKPVPSKRPKKVDELVKLFDQRYVRETYQGVECGWEL